MLVVVGPYTGRRARMMRRCWFAGTEKCDAAWREFLWAAPEKACGIACGALLYRLRQARHWATESLRRGSFVSVVLAERRRLPGGGITPWRAMLPPPRLRAKCARKDSTMRHPWRLRWRASASRWWGLADDAKRRTHDALWNRQVNRAAGMGNCNLAVRPKHRHKDMIGHN